MSRQKPQSKSSDEKRKKNLLPQKSETRQESSFEWFKFDLFVNESSVQSSVKSSHNPQTNKKKNKNDASKKRTFKKSKKYSKALW